MALIDHFDRAARLWPRRACFVDGTVRVTYEAAADTSHRIALALRTAGVGIETPVAVWSVNSAAAMQAVLGVLRSGATWLPVNARAAHVEVRTFLARHRCEVLLYGRSFEPIVAALVTELPALRLVCCIDAEPAGATSVPHWLRTQAGTAPEAEVGGHHVAVIKPTGGTTGDAKSVMQTHGNFDALVATFLACMHFDEPPVHLVAAPITHGAGSICFPLFAVGATHVILERAEPGAVLRAIETHRVNVLFLPPTVIYMMLAHPELAQHDYRSLKYFIYAAAPMSVDKLRAAIDAFGPVMAQTYGQAEAPMLCTFLGPNEHALDAGAGRLASCGRATPFTRLAIMDDDGRLLGPGARGEIVVRGPLVFKGYFDDPQATQDVSRFGWHHTGDVGWLDDDGYCHIVDRKRDLIISGGFNVFPSEIEQVIWRHDAVQDCAVIGVPDDVWGEAVKAVVELKPGRTLDPDALIAWCRRELGGVKTPKSVEIWPELPRSPVGKVLKKDVRRRFWAGRDRVI